MTDELKPCPFCGSMPMPYGKFVRDYMWGFRCSGCPTKISMINDDEQEAIKAWNKREYRGLT